MLRAARFRSNIAIGSTFVLVSLSFAVKAEIRELKGLTGWQAWAAWFASFLLSLFFANVGTTWLWNRAIKICLFRKWILGPLWIEGFWFMQVADAANEIVQVSLVEFWYPDTELNLFGHFDSVDLAPATGAEKRTTPILMTIDERYQYVHHFRQHDSATGTTQGTGVAVGVFSADRGKTPNRYIGTFTYLVPTETRSETGYKLEDAKPEEWRKKFGSNWRQKVLHDPQELAKLCIVYKPVKLTLLSTGV